MIAELREKAEQARKSARHLSTLNTRTKNQALQRIAELLRSDSEAVLEANQQDLQAARASRLRHEVLDRLLLTPERLDGIAHDVQAVAALPDPVGESFDAVVLPNGLQVAKRRVPLGVIGVIYESRPNVTVDISALCLKSGNAAILRGGKEARHTNRALADLLVRAVSRCGIPTGCIQLIDSTDRKLVLQMLRARLYIDMIIPRGGAGLHELALENATIPVITGGIGICHAYVDLAADPAKTVPIIFNAKVQRPTVCNSLDTLLIHSQIAPSLLRQIADKLATAKVELRCDPRSHTLLKGHPQAGPAGEQDYDTEFLSLVLAVKVVDSTEEALEHIHAHGTHHSDSIITEDYSQAMRFVNEVDSAAVYVNASTRFTDGGQLGLGAEVAVSTQRLHARGPMGLRELTTYKWVIFGNGQVRD